MEVLVLNADVGKDQVHSIQWQSFQFQLVFEHRVCLVYHVFTFFNTMIFFSRLAELEKIVRFFFGV